MTALIVPQQSPPTVTDGCCVLTVGQALPCPDYLWRAARPHVEDADPWCDHCMPDCGGVCHEDNGTGDSLVPPGTPIVVKVPKWHSARCKEEGFSTRCLPAEVTIVGKLAEQNAARADGVPYRWLVSLVDVRVLTEPITEWTQVEMVPGGSLPMTYPVSSLPDTVSICPQALWAAIEEAG